MASGDYGLLNSYDIRTGFISGRTFTNRPVTYSVVDGLAIFEGCIVLGRVDEVEAKAARIRAGDLAEIQRGVAITGQQYRWPDGLMPYDVDASLPGQNRVTDAIAHWTSRTSVRCVLRTAANAAQYPNWVRFRPATGCWSSVGMQGGMQEIGLAAGCSTGNTIHEIGHALGLWHEQSREDRDTFITINWANIEDSAKHNFNQHITDGDDIGAYDYGSIMHYGAFAFSKNGQPTIVPKQSGVTIGQRTALSAGDVAAIHHIYRLWYYNRRVFQTFVSHHSKNAWGLIEGLGWRKVFPDATDGVTNLFAMLCEAAAGSGRVNVHTDGTHLYILYLV